MSKQFYSTEWAELTAERLAKHHMNPLKGSHDRFRIKHGSSAMSHKAPVMGNTNLFAVQPFTKTGYGQAMM